MRGPASEDLATARRLEVGLIGLRWLTVAFAVLQSVTTATSADPGPDHVLPIGFLLVAVLAIGNVGISVLTERAARLDQLRRVGLGAFVLDVVLVTALVWTYATSHNSLWVIAYVLPLEGAVRFGLAGALVAVAVTTVSEPLRELSLRDPTHLPELWGVVFRIGVGLVVAVVAGLMARTMRREASLARERAKLAEQAARAAEASARRETAARREISAFHAALIAGVAAGDASSAIASMTGSIARDLDLEAFAILLLDGGELVAKGVHGDPGYDLGDRLRPGEGLPGRVAASRTEERRTQPVPEVAVPLRVGDRLVGVLHERRPSGVGDPLPRDVVASLADQVAMVAEAALLRDRQEETLRRLRELDDMKSDFVAITSHELRTPLAAIRGFVNTLLRRIDELSPNEVREFLGIVDTQTDRLIRLVEDLLVVTRIEAGKLAFDAEPIEAGPFLERLVQGLGERSACVQRDVHLGRFVADPHRVGQVLTNLLENALKFSLPPEPVLVSAVADGDDAVFRVSDRGVGIAPEDVPRIFERFHQTDAASTRRAEGAGLGLYITKKLVEAMGGRIEVSSVLGAGSTFTVRLPLGLQPAPARPSAAARAG